MVKQAPLRRPIGHRSAAVEWPVAWPVVCSLAGAVLLSLSLALAAGAPQRTVTMQADPNALTPAQIHALVARAILNQHKDDAALYEYERTERITTRGEAGASHEATTRVVPHGITGSFRVQLERDAVPTDALTLARQWRNVQQTMAIYADANNPLVKTDLAKAARENREYDQLKDAIGMAFEFHWVGRTTREGRTLIELSFEPDPSYKPTLRYSNLFQHVRGTAWIDESSGHVARVQAELFEDVSFGAGIIAKLYRGAKLTVDQTEVMPGVWFPALYDVDLDGRKFLFSFSMHQKIEISAHRRIGPPQEALALLERDLSVAPVGPAAPRAAHGDPPIGRNDDPLSDPFHDH